jgi:cobalt-precorrin 5A hydrolase
MKIACLSFSRFGDALAEKIKQRSKDDIECYYKSDYKVELPRIFNDFEGIIFISSAGIAVRLIAPYLTSKSQDPAVVVVDDTAKFAISLVSGHLGRANELTRNLAEILGCQPVITTASDNRGIEAVDMFALRNKLVIEDLQAAKRITALMVDGKRIGFYSPFHQKIDYPNLVRNHPEGCIFVDIAEKIDCSVPFCLLRPKILHIGIGCRKETPANGIIEAIEQVFRANNLSLKAIASLATIDLKKHEPGIMEACRYFGCELITYTPVQLKTVEHLFQQSDFVRETTGVGAVSEPAAYLSGKNLIVSRQVFEGITLAVSKMD